jgi:UMF1 family MFS transporter
MVPDKPKSTLPMGKAISQGLASLLDTIKRVREHRMMARFLLARMIYTDGLTTLFAFGGIYAVGTFGLSFEELILFGIAMNLTAGIGAFVFSWADDKFGAKLVIMISVTGLSLLGLALILAETKTMFWVFGLPLGIFVGPAQSASRSMMARLAPVEIRTEMFGLFALSGKATAFLGPMLLAIVTEATGSQRWGMATILAFFVVGLFLMRGVDAPD